MLLCGLRVNQNIIYKDYNESVQVRSKYSIHRHYKHSRSIGQTKRHHQKFIMSIPCPKSCFLYILVSNSQLMVSEPKINFREIRCTLKLIKQFIYMLQWIFILNSHLIYLPIINTHSKGTILFPHK